jgi:Rhs element Vgr protein
MPISNLTNGLLNGRTSSHLTTFTIKVDGTQLPVEYGITSINIENVINSIPTAQIVLEDGDAAQQGFEISSSSNLIPGKELEILAGYSSDENTVFKGIITKQKIRVNRRGKSQLQVECKDPSFRLALNRKSRYLKEVTDEDVFEEIASGYEGVSVEFGLLPALTVYSEVVQYQVTDWDFLMMRAEKNGRYCTIKDGKLAVNSLPTVAVPVFSLEYGRDLIEVDIEMDARYQAESVEATGWNEIDQQLLSGEKEDLSVPDHGNLSGKELAEVGGATIELKHSGNLSQQELDQWAEGQMLKSRMSKIRGTLKFQGNHMAEPGAFIDLGGLGSRFNGTAFIAGIQHHIGQGDWHTTVQIGMSTEWHFQKYDAYQYPASGFTAPINGLQIGVVTQLEDDPQGNERIKVRLPIINAGDDGTWARLASADAGENRGFVWRPEVNDEVVVGFLNDDPNEAVILGALYSGAYPAPITATADNFEKGWITKSGLKVLLNDEDKSVELFTPNENRLLISDEDGGISLSDESGNKIVLNSDGIHLESAKDIILKATGDIKAEGINIEAKANASFKAEGASTAELSGGGQTTIKGGIVQIN